MAQAGSNYEKTGGQKSRWTVPLIHITQRQSPHNFSIAATWRLSIISAKQSSALATKGHLLDRTFLLAALSQNKLWQLHFYTEG